MAIKCKKCKCKVSAGEIIGYVGLEIIKLYIIAHLGAKFFDETLKDLLLKQGLSDPNRKASINLMTGICDTTNTVARTTMNTWFEILAGAMRQHKFPCPTCGTYEGWDPEIVKAPKGKSTINKSINYFSLFILLLPSYNFAAIEVVPNVAKLQALNYKQKHQELLTPLLENPKAFLLQNRKTHEQLRQQINELDCDDEQFCMLTDAAVILNPLLLVDECNDKYCSNNRCDCDNSTMRAACEKEIVHAAKRTAGQKNGPINYVSFGAGYCFSDLLIITQLLEQGVTKINFHAIDPSYDLPDVNQSTEAIKAFSFPAGTPLTQRYTLSLFSQLTHWFAGLYPNATCRIFIYKDGQAYMDCIKKEPQFTADIIAGIDFTKDYPAGIYMWEDFLILVEQTFKLNRYAIAFKDFVGSCLLCLSISEQTDAGFEAIWTAEDKKKFHELWASPEYSHMPAHEKILVHQKFCATAKVIKPMPIADHGARAHVLHLFGQG